MTVTTDFRSAVLAARRPVTLEAGGVSRRATVVSGIPGAERLPRALVVLLENVVRRAATDDDAVRMAAAVVEAGFAGAPGDEIEFMPARVLFQDFTGVPVFVDFAAMRDAMLERGGDPMLVNPQIPCTLVVDHSVIADEAESPCAVEKNQEVEAARNRERFAFLKWASRSFQNVEIVPPGGGICHQLNIERFCDVVTTDALASGDAHACFDTLVGTDSHTTTANGVGVLGWGVGGIEAEAAALGQPVSMLVPPVVELRLSGALGAGVSGMDLALTVAQLLRREGVVGAIVEVTGAGVADLSATQRACVANMTPEYGATATLFPVDDETLGYLALAGRDAGELSFARAYLEEQGVFGVPEGRAYSRTLELDLGTVEPSLAGPSRPHDRVSVSGLKERFESSALAAGRDLAKAVEVEGVGALRHGAIAIAAITSCTTATDPAMMVAAGLVARHAVERGLAPRPWVKKVLAPGSHATQLLLERCGLAEPLRQLGFFTCGFGCMSCIGNSGDIKACLKPHAAELELTSVLSGNRNFEGRISPDVTQNYLCQPALVVAYSIAGTMDVDQLGVYANSDTELVIQLERPNAFLLELLSTAPAMPCNEQFFNETKGEYGLKGAALISNSAYQADKWIVDSYIKLVPNDRYYDQDQIHLTSMIFWLCYSDTPAEGETQSEILTRFYDGDSAAYTCSGKPDQGLFDGSYQITTHPNTVWGLTFNQHSTDAVKQQILNNQDFRLAIANCFDRSRYQNLLPEYLTVTDTIIPPGVSIDNTSYREQAGEMKVYGLDSSAAKSHYQAMLNATGVQQVTGLRVLIPENDSVANEQYFGYLSQVIQRELNLYLTIETADQEDFESRLASGDYDMAILPLEADFDHPVSILEDFQSGSAENYTGYSDSTLDHYLDQLYRGSEGEAGLCKLAEQHLLDSGIFLPLYYQTSYLAVDKSVSSVFLNPQNGAVDFRYAKF